MAETLPTNTTTRYDLEGVREDLTNQIFNISPMETPLVSGIKRTKAKGTFHEWETDELAAPNTDNAHLEGSDSDVEAISPTERMGNYTQILKGVIGTSGTANAIDKAGRKSEHGYQMAKKGKELKRDLEAILLNPQAAVAGGSATARRMGTLLSFLKTNVDKEATGVDPVWTAAPTVTRTDGVQRAFTEGMLQTVAQDVWTEGGNVSVLMVGGHNKTVVSGFTGIAQSTNEVGRGTRKVIGAVDVYVSDWGELRVVPNRFQRDRDALLIDYSMLELPTLRPMFKERLAKTGDSVRDHMVYELTFKVRQEKGLGAIVDLATS